MCRLLVYKGSPIALAKVLVLPSNSLVRQSNHETSLIPGLPKCLEMPCNRDGTGVAWFSPRGELSRYRSSAPAFADSELLALTAQVESGLIFGHVRSAAAGVTGEEPASVSDVNCHPFVAEGIVFMHNGAVSGFKVVRPLLAALLAPTARGAVLGATDSELLFALFLSQLSPVAPSAANTAADGARGRHSAAELASAIDRTIGVVTNICRAAGVQHASSLNLAVTDGNHVVVTRYRNSATEQPPSLYVNAGASVASAEQSSSAASSAPASALFSASGSSRRSDSLGERDCLRFACTDVLESVAIASEPLCHKAVDGWRLVPANTMVVVEGHAGDEVGRVRRITMSPITSGALPAQLSMPAPLPRRVASPALSRAMAAAYYTDAAAADAAAEAWRRRRSSPGAVAADAAAAHAMGGMELESRATVVPA